MGDERTARTTRSGRERPGVKTWRAGAMMCGGGWRVGHSLRQSTSGSANDVLCCLVFVKPPFLAREVGGGGGWSQRAPDRASSNSHSSSAMLAACQRQRLAVPMLEPERVDSRCVCPALLITRRFESACVQEGSGLGGRGAAVAGTADGAADGRGAAAAAAAAGNRGRLTTVEHVGRESFVSMLSVEAGKGSRQTIGGVRDEEG
ncbi:hypothetical protein ACCO45_004014 [Purpureocillium lilacinum]|uniref:Uncharacterized protein n=1 Tax=Purpureocillium lilacinum TaxID=33203 RepID=A0ACC4E1J1_PURLI